MEIRDINPKDIERVLRYKRESAKISFPGKKIDEEFIRKRIRKYINMEPGLIKILYDNGKPVGYVWLNIRKTTTGIIGAIDNIFIEEGYRGKGLATKLMKEAEKFFSSRGIKRIRTTVTITNKPSIGMCKKLGYREKRIIFEKAV